MRPWDNPVIRIGNDIYIECEVADISAEQFNDPGVEPPLADPSGGLTVNLTRGPTRIAVLTGGLMTRLRRGIYAYTRTGSLADVADTYNIEVLAYHGSRVTRSQLYGAFTLVA